MDLFATPGNPIPPQAIISAVRTDDGLTLRVARWVARRDGRGTIVIALGRSEFIEEYFEVVTDLLERRFDVVVMDWRGQGQSDRETAKPQRGHVRDFSAYQKDLKALQSQILQPFAPRPWFGLGHSMGAAILLQQAHAGASPFSRLVFSAPMIDLPLRYRGLIAKVAALAVYLGFGRWMIPGGDETSIFDRGFAGNPLTSDARRYERTSLTMNHSRHLVVGAPTIGWLHAAFRAMNRLRHPRFAAEVVTPILILAAGADRIVSTRATERFAARLKTGVCITLADSRHQILVERDAIREQFWAAFDAFIPGHEFGTSGKATAPSDRTTAFDRAMASDQRTTTLVPTGTR